MSRRTSSIDIPRIALTLSAALGGLALAVFLHRTEHSRTTDPTGRYTAICSYRTYLSFIGMAPGQSSDKECFVKIVGPGGEGCGEIPVGMIQMAGVEWFPGGAEIRQVGEWNFRSKTCYHWSEDQMERIYVKD